MKKILVSIVLILALSVIGAKAQAVAPIYIPQMDPVYIHLQNQIRQQMAFGDMYKQMATGKKGSANAATAKRTPQSPAAKTVMSITAYNTSNGRLLPDRLSKAAGKNPAEIANYKQVFDVFLNNYENDARGNTLLPNDLSYAVGFFIVNHYAIVYDLLEFSPADKALMSSSGDPLLALQHSYSKQALRVSPLGEKAVFKQMGDFLASNPQIAKLTDAQKQEFTEMLAIQTVYNFYLYEQAGKNKDTRAFEQIQTKAEQALESLLGIPADKIKITEKGLVSPE